MATSFGIRTLQKLASPEVIVRKVGKGGGVVVVRIAAVHASPPLCRLLLGTHGLTLAAVAAASSFL